MTQPDTPPDAARVYPDTYYQQHRNSILFSVTTALLCLPHVLVNLDQLLFLDSASRLTSTIIPWCLWLAATYSTLHFYIEWLDHAKPHGLAVKSRLDQIDADLRSIASHVQGLEAFQQSADAIDAALKEIRVSPASAANSPVLRTMQLGVEAQIIRSVDDAEREIYYMLEQQPLSQRQTKLQKISRSFETLKEKARVDISKTFTSYGKDLQLPMISGTSAFEKNASETKSAIKQMLATLQQVLAEPRWVKQQIDLTRRWTAVRVWVVGFAPPLALWALASLLFVDSHVGYPGLRALVGDPALQAVPSAPVVERERSLPQ